VFLSASRIKNAEMFAYRFIFALAIFFAQRFAWWQIANNILQEIKTVVNINL